MLVYNTFWTLFDSLKMWVKEVLMTKTARLILLKVGQNLHEKNQLDNKNKSEEEKEGSITFLGP